MAHPHHRNWQSVAIRGVIRGCSDQPESSSYRSTWRDSMLYSHWSAPGRWASSNFYSVSNQRQVVCPNSRHLLRAIWLLCPVWHSYLFTRQAIYSCSKCVQEVTWLRFEDLSHQAQVHWFASLKPCSLVIGAHLSLYYPQSRFALWFDDFSNPWWRGWGHDSDSF